MSVVIYDTLMQDVILVQKLFWSSKLYAKILQLWVYNNATFN